MKLTFIGCGTLVPRQDRYATCFALEHDGLLSLFDVGPGTIARLPSSAIDITKVDRIFLTHFHPDHSADLGPLLFTFQNMDPARTTPLELFGGPGLLNFVEKHSDLWGDWVDPVYPFVSYEFDSKDSGVRYEIFTQKLEIKIHPMSHHASSIGYRIGSENASLAISGDTSYCPELVELARGADILVTEASVINSDDSPGHMSAIDAGRVAAEAEVNQLVLVHRYPEMDEERALGDAQSEFSGTVSIAQQGRTLQF